MPSMAVIVWLDFLEPISDVHDLLLCRESPVRRIKAEFGEYDIRIQVEFGEWI